MTRRQLIIPAFGPAFGAVLPVTPVRIPILRLRNQHSKSSAAQTKEFYEHVWDEAVETFRKCGMEMDVVDREGEVLKYPSDRPRFIGLERDRINIVVTDHVPMVWDHGRGVAGISTIYEGYHLSIAAVNEAHGFRVPFVSVNTVVHELLHLFLRDVFTAGGGVINTHSRETRVDWYATRMWLFHEGAVVRESAAEYLKILSRGRG